jgi:hypothetical protein
VKREILCNIEKSGTFKNACVAYVPARERQNANKRKFKKIAAANLSELQKRSSSELRVYREK